MQPGGAEVLTETIIGIDTETKGSAVFRIQRSLSVCATDGLRVSEFV